MGKGCRCARTRGGGGESERPTEQKSTGGRPTPLPRGHWLGTRSAVRRGRAALSEGRRTREASSPRPKGVPGLEGVLGRGQGLQPRSCSVLIPPSPFFLFFTRPSLFFSLSLFSLLAIGAPGPGIQPLLRQNHRIQAIGPWGFGPQALPPPWLRSLQDLWPHGLPPPLFFPPPLVPRSSKGLSEHPSLPPKLPSPRPSPSPATPGLCGGARPRPSVALSSPGETRRATLSPATRSAPEAVTALFALPAGSFPPWPP